MVPSLGEGEAHGASRAAVDPLVLHPVVGGRAAGLVTHRPAEHSAPTVADEDSAVIPVENMRRKTWSRAQGVEEAPIPSEGAR